MRVLDKPTCKSSFLFRSTALTALLVLNFFQFNCAFADTTPPGLNTQLGQTTLSIAVQDGVGIILSVPQNSAAGVTPNVTIPGNTTTRTVTISDQAEAVNNPCNTLGMLAETNTGILLSCQSSGATQLAWQPAQAAGGSCQYAPDLTAAGPVGAATISTTTIGISGGQGTYNWGPAETLTPPFTNGATFLAYRTKSIQTGCTGGSRIGVTCTYAPATSACVFQCQNGFWNVNGCSEYAMTGLN